MKVIIKIKKIKYDMNLNFIISFIRLNLYSDNLSAPIEDPKRMYC